MQFRFSNILLFSAIQWPRCCSFGQQASVERRASRCFWVNPNKTDTCPVCSTWIYPRRRTVLSAALQGPGVFSSSSDAQTSWGPGLLDDFSPLTSTILSPSGFWCLLIKKLPTLLWVFPVYLLPSHWQSASRIIFDPRCMSQQLPASYFNPLNLLTYSMVQSPSWAADWLVASQEIPHISRNPKVHYRTHKRPPPVPILGQSNPVHMPKPPPPGDPS